VNSKDGAAVYSSKLQLPIVGDTYLIDFNDKNSNTKDMDETDDINFQLQMIHT